MDETSDWRKTHEGALARARYLLDSGHRSDCKFLVGVSSCQELVMAHKFPLVSASPVFEIMFFGSIPAENESIEIPDIETRAFKAMLKFIYTDEVPSLNSDLSLDLYYCARKYMLPSLAAKCKNYLESNLSPQNVCKIYELAELFEETELMKKCLEFMCTETKKILTDPSWLTANRNTVSVIFEQTHLAVDSELDLYYALLAWATAECKRKSLAVSKKFLRSVSGDLLAEIRFFTLTAKEFANGPGKAEILEHDEVLAILMNKLSDNTGISIPEGFSVEKIRRLRLHGILQNRCIPSMIPYTPKDTLHCFCYRNFIQDGTLSGALLECVSTFQVDEDIEIFGILVPTQVKPVLKDPWAYYTEELHVRLYDDAFQLITYFESCEERSHNNIVQIRFDHRVVVQKQKNYHVEIVFYRPGKYPKGKAAKSVTCEQVEFTFNEHNGYYTYKDSGCLLRGIVFVKTK